MNQARGHDQRFTPLGRARAARPQATAFERSYLGTMEQVRRIARRVKGAQVLELADCGHSPHRDQPGAVIEATVRFAGSR